MLEDFFTLTEMKDGISTTARIAELVSEIQKLKDDADLNTTDSIRQCSTAANTLASTKNEECLQHFVQLNGIGLLNQWLHDAQNCSKDISSAAEDLIYAILTALECLPVDDEHSTSCGIMPTVEHLLDHGNTKINQKARVLCQKWRSELKCGRNEQHMDAKEVFLTDHLEHPEDNQETENNKQHGANGAGVADAKSNLEMLTCSGVPLPHPFLTTDNTDITKQPLVLVSTNYLDGNAALGQVNSSASALASHGSLPNVSIIKETSAPEDVSLVTNRIFRSNYLNAQSDAGHVTSVDSAIDAKSLEDMNQENSFVSSKIDAGDQSVSSSLCIKKGDSFAADRSHCEKNTKEALNHLVNLSPGLQDLSEEESMDKEDGPTSSSDMDRDGSGYEFRFKRCMKSFGDSSKEAETKSTSVKGEKSTPSSEFDDTDALEVARLVAIEVEREVIDYRGSFCGSPDVNSRTAASPDIEAHQQPDPPVDESNDNKSSGTGVDSGSSSSLKEDASGITDDSGPFSRKHARDVELGDLDLNTNLYSEDIDCHPKSNASDSLNLSMPIAVAASRGSSVFPARLHFEGELGWKGSAATSAFRPVSPRHTPEGEKSTPASSQKTSNFLFDLNVAESDIITAGDPLSTDILSFSSGLAPKDTSAAVGVRGGIRLDLNSPCEEEEAAIATSNVPSFWKRQQCYGNWSQPSCSSSSQLAARNFNLNDNALIFDGSSRGMGNSSFKTSVKDTSDHSEVTILGKRITVEQDYCNRNQHDFLGPSGVPRVPVRSLQSYAHMPPDYSVVSYPSQSAAMSSFPPALYAPGGAPYMVDAKGAPILPSLSGLSVGISHPSFASRAIQPTPSELSYFNPSMDVSYELPSEGARREAGSYWPVPFQGHSIFDDARMRNMSRGASSGVILKRKEPDSSWDIYPRH